MQTVKWLVRQPIADEERKRIVALDPLRHGGEARGFVNVEYRDTWPESCWSPLNTPPHNKGVESTAYHTTASAFDPLLAVRSTW